MSNSNSNKTPQWVLEMQERLPLLMTKDEAATALRVSRTTLERAIAQREIASIKRGPHRTFGVLIPRAEVLRYLTEHLQQ